MNFTTNEAKAIAMREQYFPHGKVYEVNLRAQPEALLQLDRPIIDQPHVQSALSSAGVTPGADLPSFARNRSTGYDALNSLHEVDTPVWRRLLNDQRISTSEEGTRKHLLASGIPGSVSADHHIIFDDKIIDILRKYGIGGIATLPPAVASQLSGHLVPVDHDPFADQSAQHRHLVPVEHDPFAAATYH